MATKASTLFKKVHGDVAELPRQANPTQTTVYDPKEWEALANQIAVIVVNCHICVASIFKVLTFLLDEAKISLQRLSHQIPEEKRK